MKFHTNSRLLVAVGLLVLAALACNRSATTATPIPLLPASPSITPFPSPAIQASTETPLPSPSPSPTLLLPTDTPTPTPTRTPTATTTPVIFSSCPPEGDPVPPDRPASFTEYPQALASYLSAGGSTQGLGHLLRDWGAIGDESGEIRSLDMTGDADPEIVVALIDPAPEFDLPWPPGDVLIFQCQGGKVVAAHQGRLAIGQEPNDFQFTLHKVEDVNGTGRADVVYVTSSCGAHTCWDRLHIIEWDGAGFVNRIPDMAEYPYATFSTENGLVQVAVAGIGSAGAGYQRTYQEDWAWNGKQFTVTQQIVGPPTALIHFIHDGDDALAKGDYGEAIRHHQAALDDTNLPLGLVLETEEHGEAIARAYARFKLVVAYAASGDKRGAQTHYDLLMAAHPQGTPGSPYALMGQVFWDDFLVNDAPRSACAAAVEIAKSDPTLAERLYAGYANPEYEAVDLCQLD